MAKKSSTKAKRAGRSSKSSCSSCEESCSHDRKGQGMSINTIIIAVLGLIVLVVLIVIFTGQTGKFTKGTTDVQGGTVCENSLIYPTGVSSLGGRWQNEPCAAGQTAANPTYPADVASHGGMSCCIGARIPSDAPRIPGNVA